MSDRILNRRIRCVGDTGAWPVWDGSDPSARFRPYRQRDAQTPWRASIAAIALLNVTAIAAPTQAHGGRGIPNATRNRTLKLRA